MFIYRLFLMHPPTCNCTVCSRVQACMGFHFVVSFVVQIIILLSLSVIKSTLCTLKCNYVWVDLVCASSGC